MEDRLLCAGGVSHGEIHGAGDGGKEKKDLFCQVIHRRKNGEKPQRQKRRYEEFHQCGKENVFADCEAVTAPDHDAGRDSGQYHEGAGEVVQHGIEEGAFQRDVEVRSSKGKKRAVEDRGRKRAKQERREGRGLLTHNGVSDRAEQQVGKGHEERQERERFRKLCCFSGGGKGQVGKGEVGEDAAKVADVRTGGHAADGLPQGWLLGEPFGKKR